ncbi:MAG: desulfoferrodoxin family protein, partial [Veillonella sp.]|nr:desulfoferrodoxin family protein [Veillonella sp.]
MAVHDYIKSGDFATEKHVPVIETVDTVKAGETFHVTLSVGKDIAHPNTVEHHIEWI